LDEGKKKTGNKKGGPLQKPNRGRGEKEHLRGRKKTKVVCRGRGETAVQKPQKPGNARTKKGQTGGFPKFTGL